MSPADEGVPRTLAELRAEIDRIDAAMHALLIERSLVIDALIKVKGTGLPGAAFRPAREADMMRRLVARHRGALPLSTVEHIWRVIIATFTHMQAAYGVVIDGSTGPSDIRDLARFQFGFDVPLEVLADPAAVVRRVGATGSDLGVVGLRQTPVTQAWWRALAGAGRPKAMGVLPFLRSQAGPRWPGALVISPPPADPAAVELHLFAARLSSELESARRFFGEGLLGFCHQAPSTELLVAATEPDGQALRSRAASAGLLLDDVASIGGIARGVAVDGPASLLYQGATA